MRQPIKKTIIATVIVVASAGATWLGWDWLGQRDTPEGLLVSNGRIEATEVDVAAKSGGRVVQILADEGDLVQAGQVLAHMQIDSLQAQLREAQAQLQQAEHTVQATQAQVSMRRSDLAAAEAVVVQRQTELDAAQRRLARTQALVKDGATTGQELDDDRASAANGRAALNAARAQATAARSAIEATEAQVTGAVSAVAAAQASLERIQSELDDSTLKAPRSGRVQYRLAQPGEMLGDSGKVLNLIDLSDVYMSFFLPTEAAGQVALGSEVRIVLDAAPDWPIPAKVTFVSRQAQFTPKSVETANERQKLMFRVKARIDAALLNQHLEYVKSGLPGVAWVKTDPQTAWPDALLVREQP
ncbi:TPA: HlyD family secretion protein [Klebsiella pneumoniae]